MTSLRAELSGRTEPSFGILLPPGWVSVEPTAETFADLAKAMSAVFRDTHRPDLDARLRPMLERAAGELMRRDPVRIMYPAGTDPDDILPLSIVVVRVTGDAGASLDARVREIVRSHGAKPFDEEANILRWSVLGSAPFDGSTVATASFNYLAAVPGSERREAYLFTGVLIVGADGAELDAAVRDGAEALMDAIMSTFQWQV